MKLVSKICIPFQWCPLEWMCCSIGLYHPPDGINNPKYKLLHFLTTIFCKELKAVAFNWDRCCHLVLCFLADSPPFNECWQISVNSSNQFFQRVLSIFFQRQDHVEKHCDVANFPFDFDSGEAVKDKKVKIIGKIGKIHFLKRHAVFWILFVYVFMWVWVWGYVGVWVWRYVGVWVHTNWTSKMTESGE
jgi:hypothetical protein